ncbi:hypothetical protein HYU17_06020 [Candidatus Woesearchaeota archaeon]|nr:hypothetical protein [Candidatus Woesearchaeota archaeon]
MITGIGSVPFTSVDKAIAFSLMHTCPYLPERVPSPEILRSTNMKLKEGIDDIIKAPGILGCTAPFKEAVNGHYNTVKVQCPGPATTAQILMLQHKEGDYTIDDALYDAFTVAEIHISASLKDLKVKEAIVFLDEPSLNTAGFDYMSLWSLIFEHQGKEFPQVAITSGVHTCCAPDWKILASSPVDIISYDASKWDITKDPAYRQSRKGKRIAWGIKKPEDIRDYQP